MKAVREARNEIAEHVAGAGKAVQQEDRRGALRPSFAIEDGETVDVDLAERERVHMESSFGRMHTRPVSSRHPPQMFDTPHQAEGKSGQRFPQESARRTRRTALLTRPYRLSAGARYGDAPTRPSSEGRCGMTAERAEGRGWDAVEIAASTGPCRGGLGGGT